MLEPIFHDDLMDTAPADRRSTPSRRPDSVAGDLDWVLDIDVQSYFDSIDWERLLKAVRHHTDRLMGASLYIERWLKAPAVEMKDGSVVPRTAGTPQGGVVSPVLANLFLHYAFDTLDGAEFSLHPFREIRGTISSATAASEEEARRLWNALEVRALGPADWFSILRRRSSSIA